MLPLYFEDDRGEPALNEALDQVARRYYHSSYSKLVSDNETESETIENVREEVAAQYFAGLKSYSVLKDSGAFAGKQNLLQKLADAIRKVLDLIMGKLKDMAGNDVIVSSAINTTEETLQKVPDEVEKAVEQTREVRAEEIAQRGERVKAEAWEGGESTTGESMSSKKVEQEDTDVVFSKKARLPFGNGVFPPYNESQSDANERAMRWAERDDVKAKDWRLASYHGSWYIIEKFDSLDYPYQIVGKIKKSAYDYYAQKWEAQYGRDDEKGLAGYQSRVDSKYRQATQNGEGRSNIDDDVPEYAGENKEVLGLDKEVYSRRQNTVNTDEGAVGGDADRARNGAERLTKSQEETSSTDLNGDATGDVAEQTRHSRKLDATMMAAAERMNADQKTGGKVKASVLGQAAKDRVWVKNRLDEVEYDENGNRRLLLPEDIAARLGLA